MKRVVNAAVIGMVAAAGAIGLADASGLNSLVGSYLKSGDPGTTFDQIVLVDTSTIDCQSTGGCILGLSAMDQIGFCNVADTWFIVVKVDGNLFDGGPDQGPAPTAAFVTGNWQGTKIIKKGRHKIEFSTEAGAATCKQGNWSVNWSLYVPGLHQG